MVNRWIPTVLSAAMLVVGLPLHAAAREDEAARLPDPPATARRMLEALQSDAEYQKQKQQFEAAERQLATDPAFQAQRDKMLLDLPMLERSADLTVQKLRMDAELQFLKAGPEIGQQQKRLQEDTNRVSAPAVSAEKSK